MKTRPLPKSLVAALVAAIMASAVPAPQAHAQSQTDAKIRLMSEALRARDSGDLAGARKALEQLNQISPNDPAVQRLRAEVEAQAAATSVAPVPPPPAAPAQPAMVEVKIPAPEQEAEALARAEAARIGELVAGAQQMLAAARTQLRDGKYNDAIATVDAALATLPNNSLTARVVADLQREKATALLDRAQAQLRSADVDGARASLAAHNAIAPVSTRSASLERQIATQPVMLSSSGKPPSPSKTPPDPQFVAERASSAALVARGRAQYVAGDIDGAQETFRQLEAKEPDNTVAKGFLLRIAQEKTESGVLNREKTRAQLLEEVAKAWQRPGIYDERARDASPTAATGPISKKLNDITIPLVNWTRAPLDVVVASLNAVAEEFDRDATPGTTKGVNILKIDTTGKNPEVTLQMRNVSLRRLLDFVTQSVGYQYQVQPDAVVIRPGGDNENPPETVFFPITRATVLRMTGMGGSASAAASRDPYSSGAPAEGAAAGGEAAAMRAFLTQAGISFTTEGTSLAYDGSAIIVTQTPRNLDRIRNLLARYNDVRQVEIEAKFMEVQEGSLEELGVTWNMSRRGVPRINPATGAPVLDSNGRQIYDPQELYSTATTNRSLVGAFPSTSTSNALVIKDPTITPSDSDPNQTAGQLRVPVSPTVIPGGVQLASTANALANIVGFVGEFDVSAAIRAISQKQGTDLLSSPKLTVLSGNPANITVAQELRYPQSYGEIQSQVGSATTGTSSAGVTITAGTPQEFTSRNVGVELKVTPTVEEDDYSISLDLNPRVTEFEGFVEYGGPSVAISGATTVTVPPGFYQPIFSVRDISTKVTIWDGATLVMGGLTREEVKKVNDKVPFFGDIPLVGRLFRSTGESAQKRNLLIFVTANLVSPGGSPKKQSLKSTPANSLFQNPTIVTPASAEPRTREGNK